MRLKRFIFCFFVFSILIASFHFVYAELPSQVPFANQTAQAQNFIEERRWEYIGQQWKEILLKNSIIDGLDEGFRKLDGLFVVLFARHYGLTLEMFFVFLMWLFTMFWLMSALTAFRRSEFLNPLLSILITTAVAQTQIFNKLATAMWKVMFYRTGALWSLVIFVFLMVALALYLYVGSRLARVLKAVREAQKKYEQEQDIKTLKAGERAKEKASS